ncbi:two component transcriptional regulator, LuxR family [Dehalogenimonas lykanthroporepellens BL-DC-9]|jgi:DNA-binding NarL/FixJ family response regulator|nr:two component transcriptional regulator, LuxR family [Dehalogenimonas lykanthroporepellens BL-DC-9]
METLTEPRETMEKIRVLIIDDHDVVREGLRTVLQNEADMVIVGEADSGRQGVTLTEELKPDVILLDLKMPGMDGFATAKEIIEHFPSAKIIMLTGYESDLYAAEATETGVHGFMGKNTPRKLLLNSIRVVNDGGTVFNYTDMLHADLSDNPPIPGSTGSSSGPEILLKSREKQVLDLIVKGLTNKEIAMKLGLAEVTVKKIIGHLLHKLNAANRTQAALAAKQLGLS